MSNGMRGVRGREEEEEKKEKDMGKEVQTPHKLRCRKDFTESQI